MTDSYTGTYLNTLPFGTEGLILCDSTLREGEQCPGAFFSLEDKIELAKRLDDLGLEQIQLPEIGFSQKLKEEAALIRKAIHRAKTELMSAGLTENWYAAADILLECDPDIIQIGFPTNPMFCVKWSQELFESICDKIPRYINYVKSHGKLVNISFQDAARADMYQLMELVKVAAQSGADRIRFSDSTGCATPEQLGYMIDCAKKIAEPYGTILGVHLHNDFGLVVANALSCIRNGARLIDVTVSGIGDRCGNPPVEDVIMALAVLYKQDMSRYRLEKLLPLSEFVEKMSSIPVFNRKPHVGKYAFSDSMDGHVKMMLEHPFAFQVYDPRVIGGERHILFGKHTGDTIIRLCSERAGLDLKQEQYDEVKLRLAELAESRKGQVLGQEDFEAVVKQIIE